MITQAQKLEKHKWTDRVLIVKTSAKQAKKYQGQLNEFSSSSKDFAERRLVLYTVIGEDFTLTDYSDSRANSSGMISTELTNNILDQNKGFEIILIGLDGQVKLQQSEVLAKENLFKLIDSMPMRKNEIRNN